MSTPWRMFVGCACGAFIGAILALHVGVHPLVIGSCFGFLAGYTAYSVRPLGTALRLAGDFVLRRSTDHSRRLRQYLSHPHPFGYAATLLYAASITTWLSRAEAGRDFLTLCATRIHTAPLIASCAVALACLSVSLILVSIIFTVLIAIAALGLRDTITTQRNQMPIPVAYRCASRWVMRGTLAMVRFGVWSFPKSVLLCIWRAFGALCRVALTLFTHIHSSRRLLCGFDAAIGAIIGHFVGNSVIGAVAGGVLGILSFEIFSIRIFNSSPATESLLSR
jgi:hypothetical protein